jgi:hypothetical protein
MHRALAGIHIEHDAVGVVQEFGLCEQVPVQRDQPHKILLAGQHLGLEPMQRGRQGRTPVPAFRRSDQAKRWVRRQAHGIVEVFVACQAAVDRLPQQIRYAELRIHTVARIAQVVGDEMLQPEALIQLADQNQPCVRRDMRALERDLQQAVERELKRLSVFFTHRVSPFVVGFLA